MEKKEFDFEKAMADLEEIAEKVEDPQTGLGEIDGYVRRSKDLIKGCREYLRSMKEKVAALSQDEAAQPQQAAQQPQQGQPAPQQTQWQQPQGRPGNDGLPF